jgi:hypothetical protein
MLGQVHQAEERYAENVGRVRLGPTLPWQVAVSTYEHVDVIDLDTGAAHALVSRPGTHPEVIGWIDGGRALALDLGKQGVEIVDIARGAVRLKQERAGRDIRVSPDGRSFGFSADPLVVIDARTGLVRAAVGGWGGYPGLPPPYPSETGAAPWWVEVAFAHGGGRAVVSSIIHPLHSAALFAELRLYDTRTWTVVAAMHGFSVPGGPAATFSDDGGTLVVADPGKSVIRLHDATSGVLRAAIPCDGAYAVRADGAAVAILERSIVVIHDVAAGRATKLATP